MSTEIMRCHLLDPSKLDPGIRRVVLWLMSLGYQTTDSGDGVSKPEGARWIDFQHVSIVVQPSELLKHVDLLTAEVQSWRLPALPFDMNVDERPSDPFVEGSYANGVAMIVVGHVHEGNLPAGLGAEPDEPYRARLENKSAEPAPKVPSDIRSRPAFGGGAVTAAELLALIGEVSGGA